jgi:SPP1 gp7 family putative phage head morphogenesis protein
LLNVNKIAIAYINGNLPEVYALNYNAIKGTLAGVRGYSFSLVDADTVRNLATVDKSLLPYKKLDPAKDIPWNMKKINAETLQGILQGESMDKIAKRLRNVQDMNKTQAIRSARTIVTGAENQGRQDSYARAEADGIILDKEWIATNDSRTRHWHADLDGKTVPQDKPFKNDFGEIMFPGDPTAHPANVYNCRCTVAAVVKGFKKLSHQKLQQKDGSMLKNIALAGLLLYSAKTKGPEKPNISVYDLQDMTLDSMSEEQLVELALYLLGQKRKNADLKKAKKLFEKSTKGQLIEYINFIGGV